MLSSVIDRPPLDLEAIKARQQATWASGDFGQIGTRIQIVGELICEAVDVLATDKVLDVAAGNGNASLAAARRFADVTSTDFVPALLEQGRVRAMADRLPIRFQVADAEHLPFPDASFDVVLSTYGVMFAPDQERAAAELLRVTKPGGRIGLANWTPEGLIGQMFKLVGTFVAPPAGVRSRSSGARRRGWRSCSARGRGTFAPRPGSARSAIARPSTGSTSSAPTTGRRTAPSPRSTRQGNGTSRSRSSSFFAAGTGTTARPSSCRPSTSKWW